MDSLLVLSDKYVSELYKNISSKLNTNKTNLYCPIFDNFIYP